MANPRSAVQTARSASTGTRMANSTAAMPSVSLAIAIRADHEHRQAFARLSCLVMVVSLHQGRVETDRLGAEARAIDGQVGVARKGDGIADDLGAISRRGGAAGPLHVALRQIDGAAIKLSRAAVEFVRGADRRIAIAKDHDAGEGPRIRGG